MKKSAIVISLLFLRIVPGVAQEYFLNVTRGLADGLGALEAMSGTITAAKLLSATSGDINAIGYDLQADINSAKNLGVNLEAFTQIITNFGTVVEKGTETVTKLGKLDTLFAAVYRGIEKTNSVANALADASSTLNFIYQDVTKTEEIIKICGQSGLISLNEMNLATSYVNSVLMDASSLVAAIGKSIRTKQKVDWLEYLDHMNKLMREKENEIRKINYEYSGMIRRKIFIDSYKEADKILYDFFF